MKILGFLLISIIIALCNYNRIIGFWPKCRCSFTKSDVTFDSGGVGRTTDVQDHHKQPVGVAGSHQNVARGSLGAPFRACSFFFVKISVFPAYGGRPTMILWAGIRENFMTKWEAATKIIVTLVSGGVQRATGTQNFHKPTMRDDRTRENIDSGSQKLVFRAILYFL